MNIHTPFNIITMVLLLLWPAVACGADASLAFDTFSRGMDAERRLRIYEARDHFDQALADTPENKGFLTHKAWFLTRFGFSEEALETFNRLLPLAAEDQKDAIYLGLAWNHQRIGQIDTALAFYKKRMPLETNDRKPALEAVRWSLHEENRRKIQTLKQKIAAGIDPIDHRRALAEVYLDQGELANVIHVASMLKDERALDLRTHLYLARAYYWSGDLRQAERVYSELDHRSPENAYLHSEWAEVRIADGRLADARTLLEKAITLYPAAITARRHLADVLARQHQDHAAVAMADTIPAEGTDRLASLMARARSRHFSGNIEGARPIYALALAEYPFYPDALWGMTETAIFTGRYAEARQTLEQWENTPADQRLISQQRRYQLYTAPTATVNAGYYSNASDFSRTDTGLSGSWYLGNEWRLTTGYRFSAFVQDGFSEIYRNTAFLDARKGLTERLQVTAGLTGHAYDDGHRSLNGTLGFAYQLTPALSIHPRFRHTEVIDSTEPFENMAYSHTVTIGAVGLNLTTNEVGGRVDYRPLPRLSFSGDVRFAEYSDDNQKRAINGEAAYRFSLQPDWRVAYNYFYLDYRDPAPVFREGSQSESAYYDPINFETHSLRLIYRNRNSDHRLAYGGEVALSHIPKSDGTGTYLSAFVGWELNDVLMLRLDARGYYQNRGIDRFGDTGYFWAENMLLSLTYRF